MFVLKLSLLTCAFYLLLSLVMEVAFDVVSRRDGFLIGGRFGAWAAAFGVVWAVAFTAAFYLMFASIRARLPH